VDVTEPPRIVFESPAKCADGRRARELLDEALGRARAPGQGWTVTMRIESTARGVLHADGSVTDDHGSPVGHRAFERRAADCSGLARAIGVWAGLVLDVEVQRPRNLARSDEPVPPEADAANRAELASPAEATVQTTAASTDTPPTPPWPASTSTEPTEPTEKAAADREWTTKRDEGRAFEVGAGAFLMTGAGGGLVAGLTPFTVIEVARGLFLRPAVLLGESVPSAGPDVSLLASRFDGCWRVAGLYTSRNGMQLDLCGGADAGALVAGQTYPYIAFGPSLDLRGELGGDLAVALRGLFDVNAVQPHGEVNHETHETIDTPLWAGRVELALSWRLR
jgi:hypothetical protein